MTDSRSADGAAWGVLTYQDIMKLCHFSDKDPDYQMSMEGPIRGAEKAFVRTAGYDLRLGSEYYLRVDGDRGYGLATASLGANEQTLVIPANGVAIVSTKETLSFDSSTIGHLSLKQDLVMHGLIMPSQSQIDAGYVGGIFVLLYNLSAREVPIQLDEPILRLELTRLHHPSNRTYSGEYREIPLARALKAPIHSGLLAMRNDVDKIQKNVTTTQLIGGLIGLFVLMSTIVTGALSYFGPLSSRVAALEQRVGQIEDVGKLRETVNSRASQAEIDALRRRLEELEEEQRATTSAGTATSPQESQ